MRTATYLLVSFALSTRAAADVQFFFTADIQPWDGSGPADVFAPTAGHGTDYTADGYHPDFTHFPQAMVANAIVQPGATAYIWAKVTPDHGLPPNLSRLTGMEWELRNHLAQRYNPALDGGDFSYYFMDERAGLGGKRWYDEPGPGGSFYKQNPQVLVATFFANGLLNTPHDQPANLWSGSTRTGLLGAVRVNTPGVYHWVFLYGLGQPEFWWGNQPEWEPAPPHRLGTLTVLPEPRALVLFALAGLLLRLRYATARRAGSRLARKDR